MGHSSGSSVTLAPLRFPGSQGSEMLAGIVGHLTVDQWTMEFTFALNQRFKRLTFMVTANERSTDVGTIDR